MSKKISVWAEKRKKTFFSGRREGRRRTERAGVYTNFIHIQTTSCKELLIAQWQALACYVSDLGSNPTITL